MLREGSILRPGFWLLLPFFLMAATGAGHTASADTLSAILADRAARLSLNAVSAGCGAAPPATPPAVLAVDGRERELITVVPDGYDPRQPYMLVVAFHGRTSPNHVVRRYFDLEENAEGRAIFVYPAGLTDDTGRFTWADAGDPPGTLRDYAFFDAIVRTMSDLYCIDRDEVFAVGHSLGAWFANSLACARGDVLRAVATVAGAPGARDCRGRVSALILHNPADRLVPFEAGVAVRDLLLEKNQLAPEPTRIEHTGFACSRYGEQPALAIVLWCPHHLSRTRSGREYAHRWPGSAGAAIMRFFLTLPPRDRPAA